MNDNRMLSQMVYENLNKEYNDFIEELQKLSKLEIIDKSYEKVMKEEIMAFFYDEDFCSVEELEIILSNENVLDHLYKEWLRCDGGIHDEIRESVLDTISSMTEDYKEVIVNENKEERKSNKINTKIERDER